MDNVNDFFATLSSCLWGWPMIVLLLGTHIFLTIRLRFPQRKIFTAIRLSVQRDKSQKGDVSQFGALATALAATIGTGNIIGVATAVALGGPGAVFWCWLTGVFGISTKYSEALLAIKYRVKSESGRMQGGPMYTLERGLGWRKMVFSLCLVHSNSRIRHRMHGASQCHFDHNACFVWHQHGVEWQHTDVAYGCCAHRRSSKHIKGVQHAGSVYGIAVCVGMRLHIVWQCLLHRAGDKTDSAFGILAGSSRRRICGRFGHDGSPLRHSARSVQQ